MPLPKTASIAARATEVYSEVWSAVLQQCWDMPPCRQGDLSDLSQLLPYLRQLLTCCACAGLLEDAMVSLSCGHCYCYSCQFRPPLLKIQCRQCRERTGLVIETQLRLVVQCYKHMCHVLAGHMNNKSPPVSPRNDASSQVLAVPQTETVVEVAAKVDSATAEIGTAGAEGTAVKEVTDPVSSDAVAQQTGEGAGTLTKGDGKENKPLTVSTVLDPIGEILREVQKGEKVSRAVLMIKPPAKYVNVKVSTSKKDHSSHPHRSTTGTLSTASPSSGLTSPPRNRGNENDNSSVTMLDEIPMDSETYTPGKSPSKSRKSKKQPQSIDVDSCTTSVPSPDNRTRTKHAYGSLDISKEEADADGNITEAKLSGTLLHTEDLEVMPGCLKEDHITVTSSSIEIKKNAPPALDSRSPVTSKPSGTKVSFKRARRPLSPRLYDTKRRKMKYIARQQQPDNAGVSQSPGTSQTVDTSQSKDDSLSVESSAACSKTNSTGSTPIQLLGEVTPSPVKRRRRSPGDVPRCRCGTNHPQVLHKICARGKCPCFSQGIACIRCLCRHCHNPINQSQ